MELQPVGGTGLRATLTATPMAWGTRLAWSCRYDGPSGTPPPDAGYGPDGGPAAPEPVTYELVLVDQAGTRVVTATWTTAGGEVTGLGASSAVPLASVDRIEIAVAGRPEPLASATL
ncbi:hypothetical protein ET471_04720 [Xylanimonas protaetiae]|uniref:Uncharacterized protein n=1 Tax=Xylanimonas protaetiae TaxID=2509457 RepID=A0A4P6F2I2_9MICO|nr:hypothetical protein ET471_04720 [Xylanimonas protaetiae]